MKDEAIEIARTEFRSRTEGRDRYGYQAVGARSATGARSGGVLLPLNVEWDTRRSDATSRSPTPSIGCRRPSDMVLDLHPGPVIVRQHPSERRPGQRSPSGPGWRPPRSIRSGPTLLVRRRRRPGSTRTTCSIRSTSCCRSPRTSASRRQPSARPFSWLEPATSTPTSASPGRRRRGRSTWRCSAEGCSATCPPGPSNRNGHGSATTSWPFGTGSGRTSPPDRTTSGAGSTGSMRSFFQSRKSPTCWQR